MSGEEKVDTRKCMAYLTITSTDKTDMKEMSGEEKVDTRKCMAYLTITSTDKTDMKDRYPYLLLNLFPDLFLYS